MQINLIRKEVGESLSDNKGLSQSKRLRDLICYCFLDPSPNFRMQGNSRRDIVLTCWSLRAGMSQREQNIYSPNHQLCLKSVGRSLKTDKQATKKSNFRIN